ncbi:MAG: hypothetical protein Q9198_003144 [Flavoplaca austrocitrina]
MYIFSIILGIAVFFFSSFSTIIAFPISIPDLVPPSLYPYPLRDAKWTPKQHKHDYPNGRKRGISPIVEPHIPIASSYPPKTPDNAPPPGNTLSTRGRPGFQHDPYKNPNKINPYLVPHHGNIPRPYGHVRPSGPGPHIYLPGADSPPKKRSESETIVSDSLSRRGPPYPKDCGIKDWIKGCFDPKAHCYCYRKRSLSTLAQNPWSS